MATKCRLDPLIYTLRVYPDTIDSSQPLSEQGDYVATASIVVQGKFATISGLVGQFSHDASADLFRRLKGLGVEQVVWERHKDGKIIYKQKNI